MRLFDAFKKQFGDSDQNMGEHVQMGQKQSEERIEDRVDRAGSGPADPTRPAFQPPAGAPVPSAPDDGEGERKSYPLVEPGSVEEQVKSALRQVYDPEIGLEVVQLGLIREIDLKSDPAEVKMMLTTPFCPYGGWLIQQVKDISESIVGKPIKVNVLPDLWDFNFMEDPGLLSGW